MAHAICGGGGAVARSDPWFLKLARRSFVEACWSRTSSYPCRLIEASTSSCVRARRQERCLALGSFYSVGRSRRPSPTANASEPACLSADVVAPASRAQHEVGRAHG